MKSEKKQLQDLLDSIQRVNLVLSGGGAKGVAHLAVLDTLVHYGIEVNAIAGSSAGALVASLYASGKDIQQILDFFKTTPLFRYTWLNPTKGGIFDSTKYEQMLDSHVYSTFAELNLPIYVSATNIEQGSIKYFAEGELHLPVIASCAIPAIFSPVEIDGSLYADGGIMDNFPIKPFEDSSVPMIGSYVCKPAPKKKKELSSIFKITNQSNSLLLYSGNRYKFDRTQYTFVFPLGNYGTFDTKKIDDIFAAAKTYVQSMIQA